MTPDDKRWFMKNPEANFRVRLPQPGEVGQIAARANTALASVVAEHRGDLPMPDSQSRWAVGILRIDARTFARLLLIRPKEWNGEENEIDGWGVGFAASFYKKVIIDRVGG